MKVRIIRKIQGRIRSLYDGINLEIIINERPIVLKSTLIQNSWIILGGNVSRLQRGGYVCVSAKVKQARTYIESRSKSPVKHKRSVKL